MLNRILIACIALVLGGGTAAAQLPAGLSAQVTPTTGPSGTIYNVVVTAHGGTFDVDGCVVRDVRQGSPNGPVVFAPFCIAIILTINSCDTLIGSWDGTDDFGSLVPPGDYWMRTGTFQGDFFWPVRVEAGPGEPTLNAQGPAQIGQPLFMSINAPTKPGAAYIAAASLTTNVGGLISPGEYLALDLTDPLFALTFPNPDPLLFGNLQGNLDGTGQVGNIVMVIPNAPFLTCAGMAWQAAVIDASGVQLTNTLHFTIQ